MKRNAMRAVLVLSAIGLAVSIFLVLLPATAKSTPSPHERTLLLSETNRFADRYLPSMSTKKREEIAARAYIEWWPRKDICYLAFIIATFSLIGLFLWWVPSRVLAAMSKLRKLIVFLVAAMGVSLSLAVYSLIRDEHMLTIEGAHADGDRIVLSGPNRSAIRSDAQLIGVFDHELTHVFGMAKYRRIARDAWLARAYAAILALERGGIQELDNETMDDKRRFMAIFDQGIYCAGGTLPPQTAEGEFIKTALPLITPLPIDPDSKIDDGADGSLLPNAYFDYGIAGIAWLPVGTERGFGAHLPGQQRKGN